MRYCSKCNMNIRGEDRKCPLCGAATVSAATNDVEHDNGEVFPKVPTIMRQYNFILRTAMFIAVAVSVLTLCINFMVPHTTLWSLYVLLGCGCLWLALFTALLRRHNIQRSILNLTLLLCALSPLIDLLIGWRGWSLSYVIPIMLSLCSCMMIITALILKIKLSVYLIYLATNCVFGLMPILFLSLKWAVVIYPGYICIIISGIIIAALLFLYTNKLLAELKRRLHM